MDIIEWFNPHNLEHLKAYKRVMNGKSWPKKLLPKDIEIPSLHISRIQSKISDAFIKEQLERKKLKDKIRYAHIYQLKPVTFEWGIEGFGFGQTSFFFDDDKQRWECWNETLKKDTVKAILCKFVDETKFIE